MGYDRGDSFPFNFEPNGIPFGSKSKVKLSPRSYPIQSEKNWKHSFLSVFSVPLDIGFIDPKIAGNGDTFYIHLHALRVLYVCILHTYMYQFTCNLHLQFNQHVFHV